MIIKIGQEPDFGAEPSVGPVPEAAERDPNIRHWLALAFAGCSFRRIPF